MPMVLFCRKCGAKNLFGRNWIEESDTCGACGSFGQWTKTETPVTPEKPYTLNRNDKQFLRSIRVQSE